MHRKAGLTAILGLGSSPGIMNLMAKTLVDKLDTVETIEMSFAYASLGTSSLPLKIPFGGALTEFIAKVFTRYNSTQSDRLRLLPAEEVF